MMVCNLRTLEAKTGRSKVYDQSEYIEGLWFVEVEKEKERIVWLLVEFYSHIHGTE